MTGLGTIQIMLRTGKSKTRVRRWQERFMQEGVDGLQSAAIAVRGARIPRARARLTPGDRRLDHSRDADPVCRFQARLMAGR